MGNQLLGRLQIPKWAQHQVGSEEILRRQRKGETEGREKENEVNVKQVEILWLQQMLHECLSFTHHLSCRRWTVLRYEIITLTAQWKSSRLGTRILGDTPTSALPDLLPYLAGAGSSEDGIVKFYHFRGHLSILQSLSPLFSTSQASQPWLHLATRSGQSLQQLDKDHEAIADTRICKQSLLPSKALSQALPFHGIVGPSLFGQRQHRVGGRTSDEASRGVLSPRLAHSLALASFHIYSTPEILFAISMTPSLFAWTHKGSSWPRPCLSFCLCLPSLPALLLTPATLAFFLFLEDTKLSRYVEPSPWLTPVLRVFPQIFEGWL